MTSDAVVRLPEKGNPSKKIHYCCKVFWWVGLILQIPAIPILPFMRWVGFATEKILEAIPSIERLYSNYGVQLLIIALALWAFIFIMYLKRDTDKREEDKSKGILRLWRQIRNIALITTSIVTLSATMITLILIAYLSLL